MAITKQPDGTWKLDLRVSGRDSRRVCKVFTTKAEALSYERHILKEVDDKLLLGNASLWEVMQRWHDLHGQQLADEIPQSRGPLFSSCRKAFAQAIQAYRTHLPRRSNGSYFTPHLRQPFYDERRQYSGIKTNPRPRRHQRNHALRPLSPEHLDDAITKKPLANLEKVNNENHKHYVGMFINNYCCTVRNIL